MAPKLNKQQKKKLDSLVNKDNFLFGRDKLYKYVRENFPKLNISRRQVMDYINQSEIHQLYKPVKRTKRIKKTLAKKKLNMLGCDLIDMQNYQYKEYKYIFSLIDMYSRYAWCVSLKTKDITSIIPNVFDLLNKINKEHGQIKTLRSDNGSEFISKEFKQMLKQLNIRQVLSNAHEPQSNGMIESFNGVLKKQVKKYITLTDKNDWPDVLNKIVDNYNKTFHRIIKTTPFKAFNGTTNEDVVQNTAKNNSDKNDNDFNEKTKFKKGDTVRIKLKTKKNYKQDELWSRELYTVYKVFKPRIKRNKASYFVKDKYKKYNEKMYDNDLQLVDKTMINNVKKPVRYTINKILGKKKIKNKIHYLVSWQGYSQKHNSYEPRAELIKDIPKIIKQYENKK